MSDEKPPKPPKPPQKPKKPQPSPLRVVREDTANRKPRREGRRLMGDVLQLKPGWVAGLGVCGSCGQYVTTVAPAGRTTRLECGWCGEYTVAVIPFEARDRDGKSRGV